MHFYSDLLLKIEYSDLKLIKFEITYHMIKLICHLYYIIDMLRVFFYFLFWCFIISRFFIQIYLIRILVLPYCWLFCMCLVFQPPCKYLQASLILNLHYRYITFLQAWLLSLLFLLYSLLLVELTLLFYESNLCYKVWFFSFLLIYIDVFILLLKILVIIHSCFAWFPFYYFFDSWFVWGACCMLLDLWSIMFMS